MEKTNPSRSRKNDIVAVLIAEYESLWTETLSRLDAQKQILNLQVLVVAASVSGVEVFKSTPILYLFGGILLGLLSWVMIEQTVRSQRVGYYIQTVLSRKVDTVLGANKSNFKCLEYFNWMYTTQWRNIMTEVLGLAKFSFGFILAIVFCILFWLTKRSNTTSWQKSETLLFITNILILVIPLILGGLSGLRMFIKNKH